MKESSVWVTWKHFLRKRKKMLFIWLVVHAFVFLTSRANFVSFEDQNFSPFSKHADYSEVFLVLWTTFTLHISWFCTIFLIAILKIKENATACDKDVN